MRTNKSNYPTFLRIERRWIDQIVKMMRGLKSKWMSNPPAKDPSNAPIIPPRDLNRDRRLAESEQSGDQVEEMKGEVDIEVGLPKKQPSTGGGDIDKVVDLSEEPRGCNLMQRLMRILLTPVTS